ncbi:hypothetical protein RHMOL_Rhmol04G0238100 [Rhododendron molle]|uniref:Uncharacterized protein n=1 Tax=Rhododendron molle TaxID=49168 RepID=A0ACC0P3H9_RHOML|nr:hypothetical protein RHMOL_Rhmol04G0238100 [Rhododendron molle]
MRTSNHRIIIGVSIMVVSLASFASACYCNTFLIDALFSSTSPPRSFDSMPIWGYRLTHHQDRSVKPRRSLPPSPA